MPDVLLTYANRHIYSISRLEHLCVGFRYAPAMIAHLLACSCPARFVIDLDGST